MIAKELASYSNSRAIRHSVKISGIDAVYFEYPAKTENAKTLVMVHGYRGNHHGLEAIAAGLSAFRVIIPDLPGFGESDPLEKSHSVANYSTWLHEFVLALGISTSLNLMGHSFGTLVVGHYATLYPVASVSLVNPVSTPALEGPRAALTTLTKIYYHAAAIAPKFVGEWLLRNKAAVMVMSVVMAKSRSKKVRRWIHDQHLANFSDFASVRVASEGYSASISTDLSKMAEDIGSPALIIAATLDDITDIDSQRRVAKLYPNASLREIDNVGHLVHYEAPDRAAELISQFLNEQP